MLRKKYHSDSNIYKARLVAKGFQQKERIDYFDTYAQTDYFDTYMPVAVLITIRVLFSLISLYNLFCLSNRCQNDILK